MHLVLMHWKIIRTEQAIQDFLRYWSEVLTIPDRAGLMGEFWAVGGGCWPCP